MRALQGGAPLFGKEGDGDVCQRRRVVMDCFLISPGRLLDLPNDSFPSSLGRQ